jgi:hypothetical protein
MECIKFYRLLDRILNTKYVFLLYNFLDLRIFFKIFVFTNIFFFDIFLFAYLIHVNHSHDIKDT